MGTDLGLHVFNSTQPHHHVLALQHNHDSTIHSAYNPRSSESQATPDKHNRITEARMLCPHPARRVNADREMPLRLESVGSIAAMVSELFGIAVPWRACAYHLQGNYGYP